ncbi:hypothetical protein AB6A40_010440 [Gnathostoma spinigerum]|uniref:Peptidase A1 domain-containing protein n=1 Tax=Gnathostoma spinigerum TaxID=75299 RepID=A0ABD6EWK1_9BILA
MLGLGWESIAQYRIPPPFFSIAPQLDKKVFTLWLKRTIKPTMRSYGGQLTLGGFDHQHCEKDISYVTLAAQTWWIFPLDGFKLGSVEVFHRRLAITSSGASYIGVPFVYVNKIVNVLKAKRGFPPPIDCSRMHNSPNFTFSINGREYSIPSFEYIINVGDRFEDKCVVGIFSMEAPGFGPSWVLGDPFLRTFCNIHDVENARLGFAVAKQSKSEKSVIY